PRSRSTRDPAGTSGSPAVLEVLGPFAADDGLRFDDQGLVAGRDGPIAPLLAPRARVVPATEASDDRLDVLAGEACRSLGEHVPLGRLGVAVSLAPDRHGGMSGLTYDAAMQRIGCGHDPDQAVGVLVPDGDRQRAAAGPRDREDGNMRASQDLG